MLIGYSFYLRVLWMWFRGFHVCAVCSKKHAKKCSVVMFYYILTSSLCFSNVCCSYNCDKRNEHIILYGKFISISWLIAIFSAFVFINILVSDWLEIMSMECCVQCLQTYYQGQLVWWNINTVSCQCGIDMLMYNLYEVIIELNYKIVHILIVAKLLRRGTYVKHLK